jgi:septum site-determining protein MinC
MAPRQAASAPASNSSLLPFQIRGANFSLLALKVTDPLDPEFFARLSETLALAPGFYRNAPIVLDLSALTDAAPVDLAAFCSELRALDLTPVGLQGASEPWQRAGAGAGLAAFPAGRSTEGAARPRLQARGTAARPPSNRLVTEPVRSGQQVYAAGGDLIAMAAVSRGAEVLADGNIHVYGPLRGRALAGMAGDRGARIFCRNLDADLVSIAGFYMVSDQMDPDVIGKAVQIRLAGERLIFEPL